MLVGIHLYCTDKEFRERTNQNITTPKS
jgi:hypothetical protein